MSDEDMIRRGDAEKSLRDWQDNLNKCNYPDVAITVGMCADILQAIPAAQVTVEPCGGCGERDPQKRCIGCFHDFGTPDSAWVRKYQEHGKPLTVTPAPDAAKVDALVEAVEDAFTCGMIPKSSAAEGGANKYSEQVRVADKLRAALAAWKEGK